MKGVGGPGVTVWLLVLQKILNKGKRGGGGKRGLFVGKKEQMPKRPKDCKHRQMVGCLQGFTRLQRNRGKKRKREEEQAGRERVIGMGIFWFSPNYRGTQGRGGQVAGKLEDGVKSPEQTGFFSPKRKGSVMCGCCNHILDGQTRGVPTTAIALQRVFRHQPARSSEPKCHGKPGRPI